MRNDGGVQRGAGRWERLRRGVLLAAFAGLTATAGCMANDPPEPGAAPPEPTRLRVENQAFLDMNIFVYRSSQRIRLGTASGNSVTKFTIPANVLFGATPLRFQADPIGGSRASVTQEITVSPGDEVSLTIPPN